MEREGTVHSPRLPTAKQLEECCAVFYSTSSSPKEKETAHGLLYALAEEVDEIQGRGRVAFLVQCLQTTTAAPTVFFLCSTLSQLLRHVPLPATDLVQLVAILQSRLQQHAAGGDRALLRALCRLYATIVRLGWKEDERVHEQLLPFATELLQSPASMAGIDLLAAVVEELQPDYRHGPNHRRVCLRFRNSYLIDIFRLALCAVEQPQTRFGAVELCLICLRYDFTMSGSRGLSVQEPLLVPSNWMLLKEDATVQLFFAAIAQSDHTDPIQELALQCLASIARLKRSIFSSLMDRRRFFALFIDGIGRLLEHDGMASTHQPLSVSRFDDDARHQALCDLLLSLRASFVLHDWMCSEHAVPLLQSAARFTMATLGRFHSLGYESGVKNVLDFWAGMAKAVLSYDFDTSNTTQAHMAIKKSIELHCRSILQQVVESKLQYAAHRIEIEDTEDDPLLSFPCFVYHTGELDTISSIAQLDLLPYATFLTAHLEQCSSAWFQLLTESAPSDDVWREYAILESKIAWLIHFVCGLLSLHSSYHCSVLPSFLHPTPVRLVCLVFEIMAQMDQRRDVKQPLSAAHNWVQVEHETGINVRYELAVLQFMQSIHGLCSGEKEKSTLRSVNEAQPRSGSTQVSLTNDFMNQVVSKLGCEEILDIVAKKTMHNLTYWTHSENMVKGTITLFKSLTQGVKIVYFSAESRYPEIFSNGRMLLKCDYIRQLLHTPEQHTFDFLQNPVFLRHRTTFFHVLTSLFFMDEANHIQEHFDSFTMRFRQTSLELGSLLQQPNARVVLQEAGPQNTLIGFLRDLRGLVQAIQTQSSFEYLYSLFVPDIMSVLAQVSTLCCDRPDIMVPLLKLCADLADEQHYSPSKAPVRADHLCLFQSMAAIMTPYLSHMSQVGLQESDDQIYRLKYKGITACLKVIALGFANRLVDVPVMRFYKDESLHAVHLGIHLALRFPIPRAFDYQKIPPIYYVFFEVVSETYPMLLLELPKEPSEALFHVLVTGIQEQFPGADECDSLRSSLAVLNTMTAFALDELVRKFSTIDVSPHLIANAETYPGLLIAVLRHVLQATFIDKPTVGHAVFNLLVLYVHSIPWVKHEVLRQYVETHEPSPEVQEKLQTDLDDLLSIILQLFEGQVHAEFSRETTQNHLHRLKSMSLNAQSISIARSAFVKHFTLLFRRYRH